MRCRCGNKMRAGFRGWECGCGFIKPYMHKSLDEDERRLRRQKRKNRD